MARNSLSSRTGNCIFLSVVNMSILWSMIMNFTNIRKRKKEMVCSLKKTLIKYNADLVSFEYYYKVFGNIVIEIEHEGQKHIFVSDRGEIHHNQELVYDKSITENGHYDPFSFIIKAIERELTK